MILRSPHFLSFLPNVLILVSFEPVSHYSTYGIFLLNFRYQASIKSGNKIPTTKPASVNSYFLWYPQICINEKDNHWPKPQSLFLLRWRDFQNVINPPQNRQPKLVHVIPSARNNGLMIQLTNTRDKTDSVIFWGRPHGCSSKKNLRKMKVLKCQTSLTLKSSKLKLGIHVRSRMVNTWNFVWTSSVRMIRNIAGNSAAGFGERQSTGARNGLATGRHHRVQRRLKICVMSL